VDHPPEGRVSRSPRAPNVDGRSRGGAGLTPAPRSGMGAEGTRQHPRVDYRAHVLLLGTGEPGPDTRPLIGRSLNLSVSGLLVEADEPCAVGSELACLIPLGGRTRTLRARVARLQ